MTIDRLDKDFKIPYDEVALHSKDPAQLAEYILKLVETLQELLGKITTVSNYSIDLFDGEALYSKLKKSDGNYPVGTWRLIQVDDNWERQVQLTLGTWTFAGNFERPE